MQFLMKECEDGVPGHGKFTEASHLFGVHQHTARNLWITSKRQLDEGKQTQIKSNKKWSEDSKKRDFG